MNSIVNWQDGGCIINLYRVKIIKNAKITMGVHINRKGCERKIGIFYIEKEIEYSYSSAFNDI